MSFEVRRRESLVLLAAGLAGLAFARPAPRPSANDSSGPTPDAGRPAYLDLMPEFMTLYDAGIGKPLPMRAQALFAGFFRAHEQAYQSAGHPVTRDEVLHWLPRFDGRAAAVRVMQARFARGYADNLARFRAALPDFDERASPVTLLPSLMRFDAHLQPDGSSLPLFFDPDAIVYYHGADADLRVLFSHELFHCYQGQRNPAMCLDPDAPLYVCLWMEGTATYASECLNPGASPLHVLLDDAALAAVDDASLRRAARAMLAALDARDEATQAYFFETGHLGDGWPPRAGYAAGLRIARRLGATLTLPQMAALPAPRVRETLAQALRVMASELP